MTFMSRDIENAFPRFFIMFGDYASILEPEQLKTNIIKLLNTITKTLS